eukprot:4180380-Heterocapsa_arctica.AAC.1
MEVLIPNERTDHHNRTFPAEQQNIHNEAAEVRGDQTDYGRSKRSHTGRATPRTTLHGFAEND